MGPLRAVDLFCGIGGMTRALAGLVETVAYCEISEALPVCPGSTDEGRTASFGPYLR